ncbi:hypothetical protein RND81_09G099200 [Saponaria officinalis]|uniref:Peptidase M20 dimerisation domain-containing protein n=1 Tax=Saponaria officinalis TaxID=3572 RepID=A0AAW1IJS3_SAPOF
MSFFKWVYVFLFVHLLLAKPSICNTNLFPNDLEKIPKYFLNHTKRSDFFEWMVKIRRRLHENPEIGFEEFETSKVIREELEKLGINYKYPVAITGVLGYIGTGYPPFVALRADMDALPIQEMVEWEHKSKVAGKMHACGHDAHVAMLLGAARILQEHRDKIQGTVVLVFQPGEEGYGGAKKMIEAGALENIEAIFALHVNSALPVGHVSGRSGPLLAGSGFFEALIKGKGGHAAIPHHTVDPILAASNVIVSLQQIVSREADPLDSQVVTVGKFQGGEAFNVIPDSVIIGGTFRALLRESLLRLEKRIEEVITSQAAVQRCTATVIFADRSKLYPPTINDDNLHTFFTKIATSMLGPLNVKEAPKLTGSEDFSFYQEKVPGYFFFVGMKNETHVKTGSEHSPTFMVNEDVLPYGAALHASLAVRYLLEKEAESTSQERIIINHDEL